MKRFFKLLLCLGLLSGCADNTDRLAGKNFVMNNDAPIEITLEFSADGRYSGQVVNRYFGTYKTDGDKLEFAVGGATMMMGSAEEMNAESAYFSLLPRIRSFNLQGKKLTMQTADGQKLEFEQQEN
jgi:heat shock protein HslJ